MLSSRIPILIRAVSVSAIRRQLLAIMPVDKDAFKEIMPVVALRIPKQRCQEMMKRFKGWGTADLHAAMHAWGSWVGYPYLPVPTRRYNGSSSSLLRCGRAYTSCSCYDTTRRIHRFTLDRPKVRCLVQDGLREDTKLLLLDEKLTDLNGEPAGSTL